MEQRAQENTQQAASSSHIQGLDGLRGVAATLVFLYHTWGHWGYPLVALTFFGTAIDLTWFYHYGTEGVSIFFVLSGFLLSQPFWRAIRVRDRPVNLRRFFQRRFFRIYPAYLVAVIIFALIYDVNHPLLTRLFEVVTHLLLIHNLFETSIFNISSPLWSVATEFQLYLVLPVIFLLVGAYVRSTRRPGLAAILLFTGCGLIGADLWIWANRAVATFQPDPRWVKLGGEVLPHLPFVGIASFSSGVAFAYVYQKARDGLRRGAYLNPSTPELVSLGFVILIASVAMASPDFVGYNLAMWPTLPVLYGGLVVAIALGGRQVGLTRLLEWKPVRWVGMISYSFYLYHDFMLHLSFNRLPSMSLGPISNGTIKAVLAYGMTLVVSALSYYLIERRFHGTVRSEVAPATAPEQPAAVPEAVPQVTATE